MYILIKPSIHPLDRGAYKKEHVKRICFFNYLCHERMVPEHTEQEARAEDGDCGDARTT